MTQGHDRPIQYLAGVGPKLAERLVKLGIQTFADFLLYFPKSYEDRRKFDQISHVVPGDAGLFLLQVQSVMESHPKPKVSIIKARLADASGVAEGVWFNQSFLKGSLVAGRYLALRAKVQTDAFSGLKQLAVLDYEIFTDAEDRATWTGKLLPNYALTPGLFQKKMRQMARDVISQSIAFVRDPLPEQWRRQLQLLDKRQALKLLHFPTSLEEAQAARRRIVFDEFLVMQLFLAQRRAGQKTEKGIKLAMNGPLAHRYRTQLPYQLTRAQARVYDEISADITGGSVLNRLVQGDVGSGKTDIAVLTVLGAVDSGYQAAFMAPTEVLAEQHYLKLTRLLAPLGIELIFLKGSLTAKQKLAAKTQLAGTGACIVVGTHALIQDTVQFNRLAVVVIDEQHRFGVFQRMNLRAKGQSPHSLYLTATPIPRSLMLTAFGDLEKSIVDELPPGRQPIRTVAIAGGQLGRAFELGHQVLKEGRQLFVVYPLIEQSEKLDLKAAMEAYEQLATSVFSSYSVGLIHGKLSPKEKSRIMAEFKDNRIQVLVSTTVIEVGVDVPNASVMVIVHAERFGLAQLHQLRGRIGRGAYASTCVLVHFSPSAMAKKRIQALVNSQDGFKLAEVDLNIRGPGDVLGVRQSGMPDLNVADIIRDEAELLLAKNVAQQIIQLDPHLARPEFADLKQMVGNGQGHRVILEGLN